MLVKVIRAISVASAVAEIACCIGSMVICAKAKKAECMSDDEVKEFEKNDEESLKKKSLDDAYKYMRTLVYKKYYDSSRMMKKNDQIDEQLNKMIYKYKVKIAVAVAVIFIARSKILLNSKRGET